jgi:sec-independent protein translocase protein TatA
MEALTPWHLLLILIAFLLLVGYKKLPDATRSLGRSLRIFKSEMRKLTSDEQVAAPISDPAPSAAEREAQAREAEAEAAALRAQAPAHAVGGRTDHWPATALRPGLS